MKFIITGEPVVTITGTDYAADLPATAYDDDNTVVAQTVLRVVGQTNTTLAAFKTAMKAVAAAWKTSVAAQEDLRTRLVKVVGLEL